LVGNAAKKRVASATSATVVNSPQTFNATLGRIARDEC
jgi:hypothetical protein